MSRPGGAGGPGSPDAPPPDRRPPVPRAADAGAAPRRPPWAAPLGAWNALVFCAWLVGPFLAAGTPRWAAGWLHLAALLLGLTAHQLHVARRNPALRDARRRPGPGTKGWDVAWTFAWWPLLASAAVVAGLDFHARGATLPAAAWPAGIVALAAGLSLSASAMAASRFFEGTVRIQGERGQRVVEAGPYRRLRHPGNLGLALWAAASPLLLRSRAAVLPAAAAVTWVVLRTALEDATLRRELPGYLAYCGRTRFRLVPGVW